MDPFNPFTNEPFMRDLFDLPQNGTPKDKSLSPVIVALEKCIAITKAARDGYAKIAAREAR